MKTPYLHHRVFYLKYLFLILISSQIFACSPEDISNSDEETTTITDEESVSTDPDIVIDTPTTSPVTEEPTEEVINENLSEAEELLILVNASRAAEGLSSLILNDALTKAALTHSVDMNTNNYFDHTGLNGSRFWDRTADAGYTGVARGENIAVGQRSVEAVHNSWMTSDGHRENILKEDITEMGLGHNGSYWTQIFGRAK